MVQSFAVEPLEVPVVEEASGPILWTPAPLEPVAEREPERTPEVFEFVAAHEQYTPSPAPEPEPFVAEVAFSEPVAEAPVVEPEMPELPELMDEPVAEPEALEPVEFLDEASADPGFAFVEETPAAPVIEETIALVEEPTVEEYASHVDAPTAAEPAPEPVLEFQPEPVVAEAGCGTSDRGSGRRTGAARRYLQPREPARVAYRLHDHADVSRHRAPHGSASCGATSG